MFGIGEKPGCDVPKVSHEISEDFIKQIYPFISNMRTLINVINEFWIYKRKLKKDSADKLDDEKIMALMVYKNLYPMIMKLIMKRMDRMNRYKEV